MRTLGVIRGGHSGYLFEKKKNSDVTKFYDEKCSKWPKTRSKHKTATVIFFFFFRKNLDIQLFSYLFLIGHSVYIRINGILGYKSYVKWLFFTKQVSFRLPWTKKNCRPRRDAHLGAHLGGHFEIWNFEIFFFFFFDKIF